jgi:hypothetical protein
MTTRFNNGVTNAAANSTNHEFISMDPTKAHVYFNDFDTYVAGDWTITTTEAGAGSATEALTNVDGGVLLITTDDADNDNDFLQLSSESFLFESGKKLWFKTRFALGDISASSFVMGLQITDTSPLAVSDGVFFLVEDGDGDGTVDFLVEKNGTATTAAEIATLVDATYVTLGFYYNGSDAIKYYVNDVHTGTSVTTNLPDDEELTVSFGIQNGGAAAETLSVDYIFVAKER